MNALLIAALALVAVQAAVALPFPGAKKNQTIVLAIGGLTDASSVSDDVEIISLDSNQPLKHGTPIPQATNGFGFADFNNTIYVLGGSDGDNSGTIFDSFYSYDIVKDTWNENLPKLPTPAYGSAAVELGGRMYMLGGESAQDEQITQVYAYSTRLRKWYTLDTEIPDPASFPCATVQEKHLYYLSEANLYHSDDGAKTWQNMSSPSVARDQSACVAIGPDSILMAGGRQDGKTATNTVEVFNISSNEWKTVSPMNVARRGHAADNIVDSNNVLVCSGYDDSDNLDNTCEIYDWEQDTWTTTDFTLENARFKGGLFVNKVKI